MADLLAQLSEDVTCSICHEYFDTPKVLDCLHRFCKHCLHTYIMSRRDILYDLPCPDCRRVTKPSSFYNKEDWADTFQTDFLIASMCERLKEKRDMCKAHPDNQVLSFCKNCCTSICHVCAAVGHRRCDVVVSLRSESQQERARQEKYLEELESESAAIENNISLITTEKRALKMNYDKTVSNIKTEFQTARQHLDEEEGQMIAKLGRIKTTEEEELRRSQASDEMRLFMVNNEKDEVTTSVKLKSDVALMSRGRKMFIKKGMRKRIVPGSYASKTDIPVNRPRWEEFKKILKESVPNLTACPPHSVSTPQLITTLNKCLKNYQQKRQTQTTEFRGPLYFVESDSD